MRTLDEPGRVEEKRGVERLVRENHGWFPAQTAAGNLSVSTSPRLSTIMIQAHSQRLAVAHTQIVSV